MAVDPAQFYALTRSTRKLVVVDPGFLGDTVHLVPALWDLDRNYPEAQLLVVTSVLGGQVLNMVRCVDGVFALELSRGRRTLREQWRVLKAVRRERPETAFNFTGSDRSIFWTALTGAKCRVAHTGSRWHIWNRWLIPCWVPRQDPDLTTYEQRRRVLAACGLECGPVRFDLQVDQAASRRAAELVPPNAIHVSVSSSNVTREWPLEHHAQFFRQLWSTHSEVPVVASASAKHREQERLRKLAGALKDARLIVLPPDLTIPQLAGVLSRCRLHLGPDSGVLHLAVALNVPTVSFFRRQGAYKSFMPTGSRHVTLTVPCSCVDHHASRCEKLGISECFATIEPGRVATLVSEQLARFG